MKKNISTSSLTLILAAILFLSHSYTASAQCTGCTQTISTNSSAITISSNQVVCLTYSGTFTQTINFNGGTLCISPSTIVSSDITVNGGGTLNIYGKTTGGLTLNNGSNATVYSGGSISSGNANFIGGNLTINSGAAAAFSAAISISGGTFTSNGTFSAAGLTNNGGTTTLSGTTTITGSVVSNSGTLSINGPRATISGSFTANGGGTSNLSGGVSISGDFTNYGTVNVSGPLTISDDLTITGSFNASSSGCNSISVSGGVTNYNGTFNGNGYGLAVSPSTTGYTNGAYSAPTSQPTALSLAINGGSVNGSFTAASASVGYYLVLRYIGSAATSDVPTNGNSYATGSTVGSSKVAAIVTGGSTGTKTFTDNLPAGNCGKKAYYRIFSYNGSGACTLFNTSNPLTGNIAIPTMSAITVTASGATTFCSGGSVTLTATAGLSYSWSSSATSQSIMATTTGTYTVTATNALGCTATASKVITVNASPAVTISPSNTTVCTATSISLSTAVSGSTSYTYSWSGPGSYTSSSASVSIGSAASTNTGTYSLTVTAANTCTVSASASVVVENCLTVSGTLFDDANGNGIVDAADTKTTNGQTLYSVLSDTTGKVIATSLVASNGSFTFSNIMPNTAGMHIVVNTINPTVGNTNPGYLWPSRWAGTLANYGTNNAAGIGIYNNTGEVLPVNISTQNITNILIGYDRLPTSKVSHITISQPRRNSAVMLVSANGLDTLSGSDPEDGNIQSTFAITSVAAMNGNKLYYDADSNGVLATSEQITSYRVISKFVAKRLIISYNGTGSSSATFSYAAIDAAGKLDPTPSSYMISWAVPLPVTLINFSAVIGEGNKVNLDWATASELDNDHFEVERSSDGLQWYVIGEVKGAGTTNIGQNYTFTDLTPRSGSNYYRLKQIDVDGQYTFSMISEITINTIDAVQNLSTYPNPVNRGGIINLAAADDHIQSVVISNSFGQIVYTDNFFNDSLSQQISNIDLPTGVYIINVRTKTNVTLSSRLIIQ